MSVVIGLKLVLFAVLINMALSQRNSDTSAESPPLDLSIVKCFFIVFGEFNYAQADSACAMRNGTLATFNSLSEEHVIRHKIDWESVPGFQDGESWTGQLWLGAKKNSGDSGGWNWDTTLKPGVAFSFTNWVSGPSSTEGQDCVVMRENGWLAYKCDALVSGNKQAAGALCEMEVRREPGSDVQAASTNYCEAPLMPPSTNNLGLPIVMRKTYFLIKGNFTWDTANQACTGNDGQLATLRSNVENEFVFKNLDFGFVSSRAWIGLRRPNRASNSFVWIDGFLNANQNGFLPGQPDNAFGGGQECVAFMKNDIETMGWADLPCAAYGTPETGRDTISALCESFVIL